MKLFEFFQNLDRLVFMGGPESFAQSESAGKGPKETPLEKANREAAQAMKRVENRAKELIGSKNPRKRAWGHQLKKAVDSQASLRKRIVEKKSQNKVLARHVQRQFTNALRRIARMEKSFGGSKVDTERKKGREKLLLLVSKSILKDEYRDANVRLMKYVKNANSQKAKKYQRALGSSELIEGPQENRSSMRSRKPNLARLYDKIDDLYANPGKTTAEIRASARQIRLLTRSAVFREALANDQILKKLEYWVDTSIDPKKGKKYNEARIARRIRRSEEPLFSAEVGSSWELTTYAGLTVRVTKGKDHRYKAEITGIKGFAKESNSALARDLSKKPRRKRASPRRRA